MDELAKRRRLNRFKKISISTAVVLFVGGLIWLFYFSNFLVVKKITVVGELQHTTAEAVVSEVDIRNGVPLARLDQKAIQKSLAGITSVATVEVRRVWPSEVVLAVTERTPIAISKSATGWMLVDAEGIEFGSLSQRPSELVEVSAKTNLALVAATEVVPNIPVWMKSELLLVQAESANDLRFLLKENRLVRFGNSQSQVEKFRVLKTLLTIPASVYDVSAPNLPITRK